MTAPPVAALACVALVTKKAVSMSWFLLLHRLVCTLLRVTSGTAGLLDGGVDNSDSEPDLPSGAKSDSSSGEDGSSDGEGLLLPSHCFTGRSHEHRTALLCLSWKAPLAVGLAPTASETSRTGLLC